VHELVGYIMTKAPLGEFHQGFQNADGAAALQTKHVDFVDGWACNSFYRLYGKRLFDLVLALAILPVVAPVIAILWVATIVAGGNGFFGHERVGRHGKIFRCWKIQTMVQNSEEVLVLYLASNPQHAETWKREFKLHDDPRVTPLGRFLRKTSLDELPQVWNVIKGEMSFVGPRPVTLPELGKYGSSRPAYEAVRPGITGLWQVSGRNDLSYDERVALDRKYVSEHGILQDLRIMTLTACAVVCGTGR